MRDILSKVTTASMIAGAALLVSACGGEKATTNTANTTMGGEYNSMDTMGNMGGTDMMGGNMSGGTMGGNMSTTDNMSTNMSTNMSGNMSTTNTMNNM